jgi:hypothetical protein
MNQSHHHPCDRCQVPIACTGTLERNWDGFPETICMYYHTALSVRLPWLCETCQDAEAKRAALDALEDVRDDDARRI